MSNINTIVTIFGGTGDLTYRKLLPAFYNLLHDHKIDESLRIVIVGRREYTSEAYREKLVPWLRQHSRFTVSDDILYTFLERITYFEMTFTEYEGYPRLKELFDSLDDTCNVKHKHLFYFAVSPAYFVTIASNLNEAGFSTDSQLIIEKPFGENLQSSIDINAALTCIFSPDSIYRIDHYLAKEMVQNIFTLRFDNALFESIWNKDMIDNIQISVAESVGVENRGNFYDATGALKDMVQSHLLQIVSIVAMDKPETFDASSIHEKQEDILNHLTIQNPSEDIVYAQYVKNQASLSYLDELNVNPESKTETFVALKVLIDTPKWRDVPFFIRTGKRMHKRSSEVVIELKSRDNSPKNIIVIKIQPDEGIYVRFNVKKPGTSQEMQTVFLDFCKSCNYEFRRNTPEAYERLLFAALNGDHTLFASFNQVSQCWSLIETWIKQTENNTMHTYNAFTDGPEASHTLLHKHNTDWFEEQVLGDYFEQQNT